MAAAPDTVETVAHIIQVALTPVFLFNGVATLLAVLSTRLGRVADRVDMLSDRIEAASPRERERMQRRLAYLRRRSHLLDAAVILAALAGMSTLLAAGLLFLGVLREAAASFWMFATFGVALALTVGALMFYLGEMLLASLGLRDEAQDTAAKAKPADPGD